MPRPAFVDETVTVEVDGQKYTLSPIGYSDLQALRSHIRSGRVRDFLAVADAMPVGERIQVLADLAARSVTVDDLDAELGTVDGGIFLVWRALAKNHPDITLDDAQRLVAKQAGLTDTVTALSGLLGGDTDRPTPEAETKPNGSTPLPT